MKVTLEDKINSKQFTLIINNVPDYCPYCHKHMKPLYLNSYLTMLEQTRHTDSGNAAAIFQCTNGQCNNVIQVLYRISKNANNHFGTSRLWIIGGRHMEKNFSTIIESISPQFVHIYNQALEGEYRSLEEIAGIGFRKALEFLIKDYAIKLNPEKAEIIQKETLAAVIRDRISNENVKKVAARAAWLGNDEAHYVRKWEEMDINNLKKLIDLSVHWIEMEEETEQALRDMPDGGR